MGFTESLNPWSVEGVVRLWCPVGLSHSLHLMWGPNAECDGVNMVNANCPQELVWRCVALVGPVLFLDCLDRDANHAMKQEEYWIGACCKGEMSQESGLHV
jgi:hypothetical protein